MSGLTAKDLVAKKSGMAHIEYLESLCAIRDEAHLSQQYMNSIAVVLKASKNLEQLNEQVAKTRGHFYSHLDENYQAQMAKSHRNSSWD